MARWARFALAMAFAVSAGCSGSGGHEDPPPCGNLRDGAGLCEPPPVPDTTPPTVVSGSPRTGDVLDWEFGDALTVTFSEPLDPASVNLSNVRVYADGRLVPSAVELWDSGKEIAIRPTSLPVPCTVNVELTPALRDVAGNAFAGQTSPWTFSVRGLVTGGPTPVPDAVGGAQVPSIAVDGEGAAYVGVSGVEVIRHLGHLWDPELWHSYAGRVVGGGAGAVWTIGVAVGEIGVWQRGAAGWRELEGPSSVENVWELFFVPRAEDPLVVSTGCHTVDGECVALLDVRARGADGAWKSWGSVEQQLLFPDVAWAPDGEAYVIGSLRSGGARVFHLTPGGPVPLPDLDQGGGDGPGTCALAVGADDLPVVAVPVAGAGVQVRKWNGTSWDPIGAPVHVQAAPTFLRPDLAVAADGTPVLAWSERVGTSPGQLYLSRWSADRGWTTLPVSLNADVAHDVQGVALTLTGAGGALLAWPEATGETHSDAYGSYPLYRVWLLAR